MNIKVIASCLFLLFGIIVYSQDNEANKMVATLDFGGNSGGYSLNGEFVLFEKDNYSINTRLGFGYLPIDNTQFIAVPLGFNVLHGKGIHHFEGGLGMSYIQGLTLMLYNDEIYTDKALYFIPSVGYRFDKLSSGLIFKVYYSPLILAYDLLNEGEFIDKIIPEETVSGGVTQEDLFNNIYGDNFFPRAKSKFGYFGVTIGYRFSL